MPGLKVVDPSAPRVTVERHHMVDRPATVDGMVVGFREFWAKFDVFTRAFEDLISAEHDVRGSQRVDGTRPRSGAVLERWHEFGRAVDWRSQVSAAAGDARPGRSWTPANWKPVACRR